MNDDLVQRMVQLNGDVGDLFLRDDDATPVLDMPCPYLVDDEGYKYCIQNGICPYKLVSNCENYLLYEAKKHGVKVVR